MGGKKSSKAPKPDPQIGEAAKMQAAIAAEWLDFSRDQFAVANERQTDIDAMSKRIAEQQMATQDQANKWATEDRNRYKSVFQPMEDEYIDKAKNWDSEERQQQMAAEARADVQGSSDAARRIRERNQASMGVNPNSGRFAGADRAADFETTLASAGAQNQARNQVRTQGMAMQADALNMGRGLPSQAAGAAGLGLSAGGAAMGTTLGAHNSFLGNGGIMSQGFSGAQQGYNSQAGILNTQHSNALQAWQTETNASANASAGMWSGIGSAAGMGMMAFSSKDYKTDKKPARSGLKAVKKMPVEEWKYKDGIADGGEHIGPYAEDFQKATGKGDGKMINVMDAVGVTMKAVQELDAKIDKLGQNKGVGIKRGGK